MYKSDSDEESSEDSDGSVKSTMSSAHLRYEYNVILLGAAECGKSALVSRFMDTEVYLKNYNETIVDTYH